jgi:hypothetical protein
MAPPLLAGTLEKQSKWRKEWVPRFMVLHADRVDYYLSPPAIVDGDHVQGRRGFFPVFDVYALEEAGRPHCISVGGELLSCHSEVEQQRWLEQLTIAAGNTQQTQSTPGRLSWSSPGSSFVQVLSHAQSHSPPPAVPSIQATNRFVVLLPDGQTRELQLHQQTTVELSPPGILTALLLDEGSASTAGTRAFCTMPLGDKNVSDLTFPVRPLAKSASTGQWQVGVRFHGHRLIPVSANLRLVVIGLLSLTLAFLCAGNLLGAAVVVVLSAGMLLLERFRGHESQRARQEVTFSMESVEALSIPAPIGRSRTSSCESESGRRLSGSTAVPSSCATMPAWVGDWRLDKTCSESYSGILADLGVNYMLRKLADAATSEMIITLTATHVVLHIKVWVSVWDEVPVDGSWAVKPVPPGSKYKGNCRVRIEAKTDTSLEMISEFVDGTTLRDTLEVAEDGESFTRTVIRGELTCKRVFVRI